jgi:hypothetical protein
MREDFGRKLTKNEFDNIVQKINGWFKSIPEIFEYLMETGSFTWTKDGFTNKLGLLYKTHSEVMLHKNPNKQEDFTYLKNLIDEEQGTDKHFFFYINYHKSPQMWRLKDNRCIWGMVHESYDPLQTIYFTMLKMKKQKEKLEKKLTKEQSVFSKYVEGIEIEEEDWLQEYV